jgi:hypothetical protein
LNGLNFDLKLPAELGHKLARLEQLAGDVLAAVQGLRTAVLLAAAVCLVCTLVLAWKRR